MAKGPRNLTQAFQRSTQMHMQYDLPVRPFMPILRCVFRGPYLRPILRRGRNMPRLFARVRNLAVVGKLTLLAAVLLGLTACPQGQGGEGEGGMGGIGAILPLILIFVVFYFKFIWSINMEKTWVCSIFIN